MTSVAGSAEDGDRRNVSDAVGVLVLGASATWSLITAAAHDGRPEGVLLALLAVAAGYAAGRISGALLPVAAPCAAALTGLGLAVGLPHLTPGPEIVAPLGHAGATAALLTLATGAACCAAWTTGSPALRLLLRLVAVGIAVASAALGSASGLVTCAAVLLCSLAAGQMRHRGAGIAGLTLAAIAVTGLTWAVAGNAVPDGLTETLRGGSLRTGSACGTTPWAWPARTPPSGWDRAASVSSARRRPSHCCPTGNLTRHRFRWPPSRGWSGYFCWGRPSAGCCTRCGALPAPRLSSSPRARP